MIKLDDCTDIGALVILEILREIWDTTDEEMIGMSEYIGFQDSDGVFDYINDEDNWRIELTPVKNGGISWKAYESGCDWIYEGSIEFNKYSEELI